MTEITKEDAIAWLKKEIETATDCAKNSRVVEAALEPEMEKFRARVEDMPWNTYAVRMAVNHKNSAQKDERARDVMTAITGWLEDPEAAQMPSVDDLALLMHAEWKRADPRSRVAMFPASYMANFADMARVVLRALSGDPT